MKNCVFLDLETSGLDHDKCSILELAMVKVIDGAILDRDPLHFYIEHPCVYYESQALDLFGDRRKDRKPHVIVVDSFGARRKLVQFIGSHTFEDDNRWTLGGKNVGVFDYPFLVNLFPQISLLTRHAFIDIGNKYEDPLDTKLPNLEICRRRAVQCGIQGTQINQTVTHTALEDAILCAELYLGWCQGLATPENWRPPLL